MRLFIFCIRFSLSACPSSASLSLTIIAFSRLIAPIAAAIASSRLWKTAPSSGGPNTISFFGAGANDALIAPLEKCFVYTFIQCNFV